ncbi:MAG TPA: heavy metal-binding domain-containing protein [Acidimicrobiales bacterium]|nr:heavy metal-binding domain-containing protein [Acidimicrobiales bacterium]
MAPEPGPGEETDLPPAALERLAARSRSGSFTSDLTADEFLAVEAVGFHPVAQVLGTCVYQIGWAGTGWCGYSGLYGGVGPLDVGWGGRGPGGFGGGFAGGIGGPTPFNPNAGMGQMGSAVREATPLAQAQYDARELAMSRMREECSRAGGDGVVGVRLDMGPFPDVPGGFEFRAVGTAVVARSRTRPRRPFLSDLSGQDFAKLAESGWIPTDMALGIAVGVRHDDIATRAVTSSWANGEVPGYTDLVSFVRHRARQALETDARRSGGQGVVISDTDLWVGEQECAGGGRDHLAHGLVVGTAIAPFRPGDSPRSALAVMPLRDRDVAEVDYRIGKYRSRS